MINDRRLLTQRRHPDSRRTRLRADAVRLLLEDPLLDLDSLDWAELGDVAERAGVIVRLADAVRRRRETLPVNFAERASRACARTQRVVQLVDRLGDTCAQAGIAHAFLKTVERYPDSGPDIDLLIADPSPNVDARILRDIPARGRGRGFRDWLGGTHTFTAAFGIVIDIHHTRLGRFGEQARYARILLPRAQARPLGPTTCLAPSAEDHFLLIAIQQLYARPALRIADVYSAIVTLKSHEQLNWDYVFATALSMGMLSAVSAYLDYVSRVYEQLFNQRLLPEAFLARFRSEEIGMDAGRDTRFPLAGAALRLYWHQVRASLEAGRWHSAARLCLLPLVAALPAASRRL